MQLSKKCQIEHCNCPSLQGNVLLPTDFKAFTSHNGLSFSCNLGADIQFQSLLRIFDIDSNKALLKIDINTSGAVASESFHDSFIFHVRVKQL